MERPNTLFTASDQHGAAPLAAVGRPAYRRRTLILRERSTGRKCEVTRYE